MRNGSKTVAGAGAGDSYGSMGPKGHVEHLDLVMGAMSSPQWVPNGGLRWSFLAETLHVGRGIQWPLMAYIATQMTVISDCSFFGDPWDQGCTVNTSAMQWGA